MKTDLFEGSVASSLEGAEDVVDAAFPKVVSWCYNFVGVDEQGMWPTSSDARGMRWVQR